MKRLLGPAIVALVALIFAPVGIALALALVPFVALANVLSGLWRSRRGPGPPESQTDEPSHSPRVPEYTSGSALGEGSIR